MNGHRARSSWRTLAGILAVIVTFVTTYSLILPAITVSVEQVEEVGGLYLEEDDAEYEIVEDIDEQYELIPQGTDTPLAGYGTEGTLDGEFIEDDDQLAETESEMEAAGIELWNETEEETETETETEIESESKTETGTEAGAVIETEVETETDAEIETELKTEAGIETETEAETETETETEVLTDAETENTTGFNTRVAIDKNILASDGKNYKVTVTYGAEAGIPEGAELQVEEILPGKSREYEADDNHRNAHSTHDKDYEEYVSRTQDALDDGEKVAFARFFDITIVKDGTEIQPSEDVDVRIELADELSENVKAVHFGDEVEVLDAARVDAESLNDAVEFTASGFSVYGIVGTESITTTILTADGSTYEITVTFDPEAGVGSDASLQVRELTQEDGEYDSLVEQTASMIDSARSDLSYIKLLDIGIVDENGQKIVPGSPVDVQIKLLDREELGENTKIVHFAEDAKGNVTEPEVLDGTIEGDTVSFETTGFSAYAIVDGPRPVPVGWHKIGSIEELIERGRNGLYIGHTSGYYFRNTIDPKDNRRGITKTSPAQGSPPPEAVKYYFEQVEGSSDKVYAYCYADDGVTRQYVYNNNNNSLYFTDEEHKTAFTVSLNGSGFQFNNGAWYWNMQGGTKGSRFCSWNSAGDANNYMNLWYSSDIPEDPYDLHGTSYGLMNWNGGVAGKALMGSETGSNLVAKSLTTMSTTNDKKHLFVPNDSEISMWTFQWAEEDKYYLTTVVDGSTKYLRMDGDGLSLVSEPDESCKIQVVPGTGTRLGQLCLKSGSTTLTYSGSIEEGFTVNGSAGSEWLYLVDLSELTSEYFMTYTAEKVSVSDPAVTTGSKVLVYTRAWNEETLTYDYYAISSDGKVVPVYDTGDTIEWVSGQINTLLWNFVEYNWEGTDQPNFYYELYNQYSEKYLAPQITDGQILSDNTIGINLNGRKNGKYYSPIVAWDDDHYAFAGLKVEDGQIVSCPGSEAMDFYFAIMQDLNIDDTVHTVETVDNDQYGITMKIINKGTREEMSAILGNNEGGAGRVLHQGLLATKLEDDGYPITEADRSLGELYAGESDANHLFIRSIYDESGYFEYDSTQNFASLKGQSGGDFTVYKELGTHDDRSSNTLKHGQFFPFNDLKAGSFSSLNPKNIYTFDEASYERLLPDSDPRKYENLYTVNHDGKTPDYYFAMETEASFTQTPNGLDDWGHDIIFEFTGDDDFWLYVDGELVIDLGGIHSSVPGSVNFRTGDVRVNGKPTTLRDIFYNNFIKRGGSQADAQAYVDSKFVEKNVEGRTCYVFKDYSTHTMKTFYMERGAGASNLRMRFNLASVKKDTVELAKKLSGPQDSIMAEFAYQIIYKDDAGNIDYLNNAGEKKYVTYKDSINPVKYKPSLEIDGITYRDVFFLKPGEAAEITFPDEMSEYRIVECGVNTDVFQKVSVNETEITGTSGAGYADNRKDFGIDFDSTNDRAKVNYDNEVNPNALRSLTVQKQLYREDGERRIPYSEDPKATFDFTLYLAAEYDENPDESTANMQTYYVKDPDGNYCIWNKDQKKFQSLGMTNFDDLTEDEKKAAGFTTSIYGAVSKIPVDHTVEVRNILAGTQFKAVEPPAKIPDGYSFQRYVLNGEDLLYPAEQGASGIIDTSGDSKVIVRNLKGYGLRMNKTWSDAEYMAEREPTYFAVFIDTGGTPSLVAGTVKQLAYAANPQTLYWYFLRLQPGTDFEQYVIREVLISGGTPAVDEEGNVTNAESLTIEPLSHGTEFSISGKQKGETESSEFEYTVLYDEPAQQDNVRVQEVTNNRPGIILKKAQWNAAAPLAGAEFTLTDDDGNLIGTFTSDEDGLITVAFLRDDVPYTLTETHAPQGWYGLQAPLTITLSDHNISVAETEMSDYYVIDNLSATPSLTIKDRPYAFRAVKKDADTLGPLKGVKFALHKQVEVDGVITIDLNPMPGYESLTTGSDGLIPKIDNTLPAGTYELREKSRLKGYDMISGYIRFTVSDTGAITLVGTDQQPIPEEASLTGPTEQPDGSLSYEMTIVNHRFADITLNKVDNNQAPLNGATFKLCKYETSWEEVEGYENIDMTESATARLADLPIGWYRLTETSAPAGYIIRDNQVYFKIAFDERGNVTVTLTDETGTGPGTNPDASVSGTAITVRNTPGAPLPNTGGSGTLPYTFGGIMLIILAALMYSFKMRHTGKEEK